MARPIILIVLVREGMARPINFTLVVLNSCPIPFSWPVLITSLFLWISLLSPFYSVTLYSLVTLSQLSLFHKLFIRPFLLVFFIFNFYFTISTTNELPTYQTVKRETIYNILMFTSKKINSNFSHRLNWTVTTNLTVP